jgi:hypothetical protein
VKPCGACNASVANGDGEQHARLGLVHADARRCAAVVLARDAARGPDLDRYRGSDGQVHRRFRADDHDFTPDVRTYPPHLATRRYDSRCFGCWNGNAHTEALHDRAVSKAAE